MNTTMADGAAQRLDAQIADALFGQPGMSKMDVANRLRLLRGTGGPLLCSSCYGLGVIGYTSGQTPEQFEQGEYPCPDCADRQPVCQKCNGSGEGVAMAGSGPDAYEVDADCTACDGTGAGRQPVAAAVKYSLTVGGAQSWVVADGQGTRWRMWGSCGPEWTSDRDVALHFARRADAEAFANDDEDAWLIQPVGTLAQAMDTWPVIERVAKNWDGCSIGPAIRAEAEKVIGRPTQAVDLNLIREAARNWLPSDPQQQIRHHMLLSQLALIDSQAVQR